MASSRLFLRENYLGGTGLLRINTFLTNIGKPAAGATVSIIDPYDNTV